MWMGKNGRSEGIEMYKNATCIFILQLVLHLSLDSGSYKILQLDNLFKVRELLDFFLKSNVPLIINSMYIHMY